MSQRNETDLENLEGEEIMMYSKKAEDVVTFVIVRSRKDLDSPHRKTNSFHPFMAHQIFGESESIFGYKNLSIDIYYLHNSARCFVSIKYSGEIQKDNIKPDDIMALLKPWLPENFRTKREDFIKDLENEPHTRTFGVLVDEFENEIKDSGRTLRNKYKVTLCDIRNDEFKQFHSRYETLIIWYIDGANFVDLEDPRWLFFYLYEESEDEITKETIISPIGYCTAYKFWSYPDSERPRISQFFILPTHHRRGLGTKFYNSVFTYLKNMPNVIDITVEEPTSELQRIRDFSDCLTIYNDMAEQDLIYLGNGKKIANIIKKHKICKKQSQRVIDILSALNALRNGQKEYNKLLENIKSRIEMEYERDSRGSKRICNLERVGITKETPVDKKAVTDIEYKKYIESIEPPLNRLKTYLSTM